MWNPSPEELKQLKCNGFDRMDVFAVKPPKKDIIIVAKPATYVDFALAKYYWLLMPLTKVSICDKDGNLTKVESWVNSDSGDIITLVHGTTLILNAPKNMSETEKDLFEMKLDEINEEEVKLING